MVYCRIQLSRPGPPVTDIPRGNGGYPASLDLFDHRDRTMTTPRASRNGDKVNFACVSGEEGPVMQSLSFLRFHASSLTNRAMHYFVT